MQMKSLPAPSRPRARHSALLAISMLASRALALSAILLLASTALAQPLAQEVTPVLEKTQPNPSSSLAVSIGTQRGPGDRALSPALAASCWPCWDQYQTHIPSTFTVTCRKPALPWHLQNTSLVLLGGSPQFTLSADTNCTTGGSGDAASCSPRQWLGVALRNVYEIDDSGNAVAEVRGCKRLASVAWCRCRHRQDRPPSCSLMHPFICPPLRRGAAARC